MKYIRWILWSAWYAVTPDPKSLEGLLDKVVRTRAPWFKFEPCVYKNEDGRCWEILFENVSTYESTVTLTVHAMVSQEDERIVGLLIYQSALDRAMREQVNGGAK